MMESSTLQLVLTADKVNDLITKHLSKSLQSKGYESATPAMLNFLSTLECGVNYGSEIARNLGVSRQMVAKTVKEFCRLGFLEQIEGVGKQKEILFTERGEQLMSDARALLAELDHRFTHSLKNRTLENAVDSLAQIEKSLNDIED
ncbi:MAG: hypothetical protein KTR18_15885 [Acidiferrobacterales bacterium]|nr:hypothetical protein [Acidiferrobacterales bacterium]